MRRCSRDCILVLVDDGERQMDSMQMDSRRICPQRLAEEGVLPKPCMGWR